MIAGGEPVEIEETIALDGRSTVYRSVEFPLTDEAGEPYGVCGISTDISERKQTERALPEAQQRLGSAFDDAPTGMAMVGTDGRFRQVNAALCKLTGRTEAELLKLTLANTIHPEEWARASGWSSACSPARSAPTRPRAGSSAATASRAGCSSTPPR